jgi:hypothetical protein
VPAEKAAWGLVLASAVLMPLLTGSAARWHLLPAAATLRLPTELLRALPWQARTTETPAAFDQAAEKLSPSGLVSTSSRVVFHSSGFVTGHDLSRAANAKRMNRALAPAKTHSSNATPFEPFPAGVVIPLTPPGPALKQPIVQGNWMKPVVRWAWAAYLSIALLLLARLARGLWIALRIWTKAERVPDEVAVRFSPGLALRWSDAVATPVTIGWGVLLPRGYAEWDEEKLRVVVAHEASHVRQGDFYLQLLAGAYVALMWISPLGWWLKHKLSELSEAISDRAGLEEARSGTQYAQILLEFAALPRSTVAGVAMAHTSNLSRRIERLLNESSFRQAFAGSRRALLAVLLVPAVLAATALIRVEAATGHVAAVTVAAQTTGVSHPDEALPAAPQEPAPAAPPSAAVSEAPAIPPPPAAPTVAPVPQIGPITVDPPVVPVIDAAAIQAQVQAQMARDSAKIQAQAERAATRAVAQAQRAAALAAKDQGFAYHWSDNGDSYALITGKDQHFNFSGKWSEDTSKQIEKARKLAGGKALWFRHNGKSYLLTDPAMVAQLESMYAPMEALGRDQEQFAKEQAEFAATEAKLGEEMAKASIPTPDISKEMAELNAAVAKLQASQSKTMSTEQWAELEGKIGALQGKIGAIQGRLGALQGLSGEKLGKLGTLEGELGEKQGLLGEKQARQAMEADRKVRAIIDQSLKDGKAKPVE